MLINLDAIDRKILALIQSDLRRPADLLGDKLGLSTSTVHRRLHRLRESKVIQAEIAVVDAKALNRPLIMIIDVELERERPELLVNFNQWVKAEPAVQQGWYVTGDVDYVLIVTARDIEDCNNFIQRLALENPNVRRFRTRVSVNTLKRGLAVPTLA